MIIPITDTKHYGADEREDIGGKDEEEEESDTGSQYGATTDDCGVYFFVAFHIHTCSITDGGESGIRTRDTQMRIPVFETGAFSRSAISPMS